jgi:tetratricopeptide (TPR) repeat protein
VVRVPAKDVPHGLSADEYVKLSIQYSLLGWPKQAVTAARKAFESGKASRRGIFKDLNPQDAQKFAPLFELLETTFEFQEQASDAVKRSLSALQSAAEFADQKLDEFEPLGDLKKELKGAFDFFGEQAGKYFGKTLEEYILPAFGLPTRDLPEGLMAIEYLYLAQRYKEMGWTEQARDACLKVRELEPGSETADLAMRFLRTRLPKQPIPHSAVEKNIEGYNQLSRGDLDGAEKTFRSLTRSFESFEWPYGNLGLIYIRKGEIERAKSVLWKALDLNADYLNAWLHLARAWAACLELSEARSCIRKALSLDPEDRQAKSLEEIINVLGTL